MHVWIQFDKLSSPEPGFKEDSFILKGGGVNLGPHYLPQHWTQPKISYSRYTKAGILTFNSQRLFNKPQSPLPPSTPFQLTTSLASYMSLALWMSRNDLKILPYLPFVAVGASVFHKHFFFGGRGRGWGVGRGGWINSRPFSEYSLYQHNCGRFSYSSVTY